MRVDSENGGGWDLPFTGPHSSVRCIIKMQLYLTECFEAKITEFLTAFYFGYLFLYDQIKVGGVHSELRIKRQYTNKLKEVQLITCIHLCS